MDKSKYLKFDGDMLRFIRSHFIMLLTIILLCGGVAVRSHSIDRSLWLDEAWVANSAYATSIEDVFWGGNWLQTTPPLYMIILRFLTNAIGDNLDLLRLIPYFFGILTLFLFIYLSRRFLNPSFALFACSLFFFSPRLVFYTIQLKQYISDVFVTLVLMILFNEYIANPNKKNFYFIAAITCVLIFLSYQAIVFTPLLIIYTIFEKNAENENHYVVNIKYGRLCCSLILILATCIVSYYYFIAPNSSTDLFFFWKNGFLVHFDLLSLLDFYKNAFDVFIRPIPFNTPFLPWDKGIVTLSIIAGLIGLILSPNNQRQRRLEILLILTIPVLTILVLNLFGKYPLGNTRTSLFLAPNFILLFVLGTQYVADFFIHIVKYVFKNFKNTSTLRKSFGFILSFMVIMTTVIRANGNPVPFLRINEVEDVKGAMNYLANKSTDDDILYVHASMREQFDLYSKVYSIQAKKVLYGDFGWPCCTRNDSTGLSGEINAFENLKIMTQKENNKVRLLFTGRIGHWNYVGRSDPDMLHEKLASKGCKRDSSKTDFRKIIIDEYTCN
jgi:hypothetical protein